MQQQRFRLPLTAPRLRFEWERRGGRPASSNRAANCRLQWLVNSRAIAFSGSLLNRNRFVERCRKSY